MSHYTGERWFVDISKWERAEQHWEEFMGRIPEYSRNRVLRMQNVMDKRRILCSAIMQRCLCNTVCDEKHRDQDNLIQYTKGKKPFLHKNFYRNIPNFNFNVSHDGDYVIIASEPLAIIGVDIMNKNDWPKIKPLLNDPENRFLRTHESHL